MSEISTDRISALITQQAETLQRLSLAYQVLLERTTAIEDALKAHGIKLNAVPNNLLTNVHA